MKSADIACSLRDAFTIFRRDSSCSHLNFLRADAYITREVRAVKFHRVLSKRGITVTAHIIEYIADLILDIIVAAGMSTFLEPLTGLSPFLFVLKRNYSANWHSLLPLGGQNIQEYRDVV